MSDTTVYEFRITETRVFDVDLDKLAVPEDVNAGPDWDQHAASMTETSGEGWELVSTQLAYVSGKTTTRGSAKTGRMTEIHHPERRALSVWRRPVEQ